jgi:hypothetical protein
VLLVGLRRRREVSVPRLVLRAGERDVEADLHDLVVGPQHRLADRRHPGVADQVDEPTQLLGMDLHVVALRSAADGSALAADRLIEGGQDVGVHVCGPLPGESALVGDDAVGVQTSDEIGRGGWRRRGVGSSVAHTCGV